MIIKQRFILLLFSLLFVGTATAQTTGLLPQDAYELRPEVEELYEDYQGIHLGAPVPVTNPKDIPQTPPKEAPNRTYNILTILVRNAGDTGEISLSDTSTLLNAQREYGETAREFRQRMPYGAWTSVHQYFKDQSNSKFNLFYTVTEYIYNTDTTGSYNTSLADAKAYEYFNAVYGSIENNFDGLCFIHTTNWRGQSFSYGAGVKSAAAGFNYPVPKQTHYWSERLILREICVATAYGICEFPPLYRSRNNDLEKSRLFDVNYNEDPKDLGTVDSDAINMAGFCLMGGLVPSTAENIKFEGHPPSINSYYKMKAGWIDVEELDQSSKLRIGVQHEGRLCHVFEPDTTKTDAKSDGEMFLTETRQNRNYESGTLLSTRGIQNPDKEGSPKDTIAPAEGLIIYHIREKQRITSLFQMEVVDSIWEEPNSSSSFYPNSVPDPGREPWRLERNAAFREVEQALVEFGYIDPTDTSLGGYGQFGDESASPNPAGGCESDGTFLSLAEAFYLEYGDRDALEKSVKFLSTNPQRHFLEYFNVIDNHNVTQVGQYNERGGYTPSGSYIPKYNQKNVSERDFPIDIEEIALAPDHNGQNFPGDGYLDSEGNYQPGGGYEPSRIYSGVSDSINGEYYDQFGRLVDFDGYLINDDGSYIIEYIFKQGAGYRKLYEPDPINPDTLVYKGIDQDGGGLYGYNQVYKDIVNRLTFPALEFFDFYKILMDGTIVTSSIKSDFSEHEMDTLHPSMSNITPVDETMATEVCSHEYYTDPSPYPDHNMHYENGFLYKEFQNSLGVAAKADTIYPQDPAYTASQAGTYERYTFTMNLDYLTRPDDLKIGIWNKGGQDLPYSVINDGGVLTELVSDNGTGTVIDRAETLEFAFNFEQLVNSPQEMGKPFPRIYNFRFARVLWTARGGINNGRQNQTDLFLNLRIKSPAILVAAAKFDDVSVIKDIEDLYKNGINVPGANGLLQMSLPQYAQYGKGRAVVANGGETTLKFWAFSNANWFVTPPTDTATKLPQWVGGYNWSGQPITLSVLKLIEAGAMGQTLQGSVDFFSDNTYVNSPEGSSHPQSVNVRVSVTDSLPPAPAIYRLLDDSSYGAAVSENIFEDSNNYLLGALQYGEEDVTVLSDRVNVIWTPIRHATHYIIYRSDEKKTAPDASDIYKIVHENDLTNEFFLSESQLYFTLPEPGTTYYSWVQTVGINDPSVEGLTSTRNDKWYYSNFFLNYYNRRFKDTRLEWLNNMLPNNDTNYLAAFSKFTDEGGICSYKANTYSSILDRHNSGDYPRIPNGTYLSYYRICKELLELRGDLNGYLEKPFSLLDLYENNFISSTNVDYTEDLEIDFPIRLSTIALAFETYESDRQTALDDVLSAMKEIKPSLNITRDELIIRLGFLPRDTELAWGWSFELFWSDADWQRKSSWNVLFGDGTFTNFDDVTNQLANAGYTPTDLKELIAEADSAITKTFNYPTNSNTDEDQVFDDNLRDLTTAVTESWNNFMDKNNLFGRSTIWESTYDNNIFFGDGFTTRTSATRTHIGPPENVAATTSLNNQVQIYWDFITPRRTIDFFDADYLYDTNNFQVWRSKERNVETATRIDNIFGAPKIEIVASEEASASSIESTFLSWFTNVSSLYRLTFKFTDENADPYPERYFYWIRTQEDHGAVSKPSKSALGFRAKDRENLLPIVDNKLDQPNADFFEDSAGDVSIRSRTDESTDLAVRLATASTRSSSTQRSKYDAAIFKELDFTTMDYGEIVMSFDYRFEDSTADGYIIAVVDGKEVFYKSAKTAGDQWLNSDYIDLSSFAGKKVMLEIGLVCDIDNPAQALWLDNLYVGGTRLSPCWELISTPGRASLSTTLNVNFIETPTIYSWDTNTQEYTSKTSKTSTLEAGEGYWIFLPEPLKDSDITLTPDRYGVYQSKLRNLPIGWSLCGPIKDVMLRDSRSLNQPSSEFHYLETYPNLCALEDVVEVTENGEFQTVQRYRLKASIWKWDSNESKYLQVVDKLEAGKAYWIFKY